MAFWGIRAGASGERESYALENDVAVIGWGDVPDLRSFATREELKQHLNSRYPDQPPHGLSIWSSQIWAFVNQVAEHDLVALPRKGARAVALGEVEGAYDFDAAAPPHMRHRRSVRWLNRQFSTAELDDDIRYSLRSLMTVFRVRPDGAEMRIRNLLESDRLQLAPQVAGQRGVAQFQFVEHATLARHQIRERIGQTFKGQRLEMLVSGILEAGGLRTLRAAGGRDGGIDIVAQGGPFGFGLPRLAVQVKSSVRAAEARDIEAFCAAARRAGSEAGLFVSWAGFSGAAHPSPMQDFFAVRLWDADQLVDELLRVYDRLDADIRRELPLRQVWALAQEVIVSPARQGPVQHAGIVARQDGMGQTQVRQA